MISEIQISALLDECEKALGVELVSIRGRLLRHAHYSATLWELIVLHACIRAGLNVEHEPGPGKPDILCSENGSGAFWIEVTTVQSRTKITGELISKLRRWTSQQLKFAGGNVCGVRIDIQQADSTKGELCVPSSNKWRGYTREKGWHEFVQGVLSGQESRWELPEGNATVVYSLISGFDGLTGSNLVVGLPYRTEDHPVYKAIKAKGKQIKKTWGQSVADKPIVLIIAADSDSSEYDRKTYTRTAGLEQAVYAALLEPRELSPMDRYNILRDGALEKIKSKRVSGSKLIAGVLFVKLKTSIDAFRLDNHKVPVPLYFHNFHALNKLSERQLEAIGSLDFGLIKFGPGWEAWQDNEKGSLLERQRRRGGKLVINSLAGGGVAIELPAVLVLRILAGDISVEDALSGYGNSISVLEIFKRALLENRSIVDASISEGNPLEHGEPRIRLEMPATGRVVVARKKSRAKKTSDD